MPTLMDPPTFAADAVDVAVVADAVVAVAVDALVGDDEDPVAAPDDAVCVLADVGAVAAVVFVEELPPQAASNVATAGATRPSFTPWAMNIRRVSR